MTEAPEQRPVKPGRIFLFFLLLLAAGLGFLLLMDMVDPDIRERVDVKVPSFSSLTKKSPVYPDIESIIGSIVDSSENVVVIEPEMKKDTVGKAKVKPKKKIIPVDTVRADASYLKELRYPIEFPSGKENILDPFFRALKTIQDKTEVIRVLHYGDSQIEGDRVTSFLRYKLQDQFGGRGTGLLRIKSVVPNASIALSLSDNWHKYAVGDEDCPDKYFGALMNKAYFGDTLLHQDTLSDSIQNAWIEIKKTNRYGYMKNHCEYSRLKLVFDSVHSPVYLSFSIEDSVIIRDSLMPEYGMQMREWIIRDSPEKLKLEFESPKSPYFYALILEGDDGVAVDNIALRGSAGLEFRRCSRNNLRQMFDLLNVELLILEFGVNVVPNVVNDYTYYQNWFYSNLEWIKKIDPDLPVIVMSVSDVARKNPQGTWYESYPNISRIRDVQRKAAFKAGYAFWDLYEAMGGKNSMAAWAFAEPPLGHTDFTHFTNKGARIISQMLYNAIIMEYNEYLSEDMATQEQQPDTAKTDTVLKVRPAVEPDSIVAEVNY